MIWFSLLVLIPLAAVVVTAAGGGWDASGRRSPTSRRAAAIKLTVGQRRSASPCVNIVMGTIIAWVLVRDRFWGKARARGAHRHPVRAADDRGRPGAALALRTGQPARHRRRQHRASAVFLALPSSPLPFVVRTVQPVLEELEPDVEEAAASLGASRFTTFRRDHPAQPDAGDRRRRGAVVRPRRSASTARWCCCRATCPFKTEVTSVRVLSASRTATPRRPRPSPPCCWHLARGDRGPRRDPEAGGPPWLNADPRTQCRRTASPGRKLRSLPARSSSSPTCSSWWPGRCPWW